MLSRPLLVPTLALLSSLAFAADPSSIVPAQGGVLLKVIASSGDAYSDGGVGTKVWAGIPDGLGVFDNGDGTMTVLCNHELNTASGVARAHNPGINPGGAYVSKLVVNKTTLAVTSLTDLIQTVYAYNRTTDAWATSATVVFNRFCSADLAEATAFFNVTSGKGVAGTTARFFLCGEESSGGRAYAHIASGTQAGQSVELPHLGLLAWENAVACPRAQDATIIACTDDTTNGYIYFYQGVKTTLGAVTDARDLVAAAGLTGGKLYVLAVPSVTQEDRTTAVGGAKGVAVTASLTQMGTTGLVNGTNFDTDAEVRAGAAAANGTKFLRTEDCAWNPLATDELWFVTTDRYDDYKNGLAGSTTAGNTHPATPAPQVGRTRLWKFKLTNPADVTAGGSLTMVLDGAEDPGLQMMDNIGFDANGRLLIQEDPGNTEPSAAIWSYQTTTGVLTKVAKFDPARFGDRGRDAASVGGALIAAGLTKDEESSGVIDASAVLGAGWWLLDAQIHKPSAGYIDGSTVTAETVEKGQLLALYVPPTFSSSNVIAAGPLTKATLSSGAVIPVRDGGFGSAIARVPGSTTDFWTLGDRGPNYDGASSSKIFCLPSYNCRVTRFKLNSDGSASMVANVLLKRAGGAPVTGLPLPAGTTGSTGEVAYPMNPDGTANTTAAITDANGMDPEGLVAAADGTFWISDEYGPFIVQFAASGTEMERLVPGTANANGRKLPQVLTKRRINRGMEGLTLTPDGTKLVGVMQNALMNNLTSSQSNTCAAVRIVVITLATGAINEYVYLLDNLASNAKGGLSEITAIDNTNFLVIERDGKFLSGSSASALKRVYKVTLTGATDVNDATDAVTGKLYGGKTVEEVAFNTTTPSTAIAKTQLNAAGITEVTKSLALDLIGTGYDHDKVEGLALVGSTLYVANDDDFGITDGVSTITSKDLPNTAGASHAYGMQDFSEIRSFSLTGVSISAANNAPTLGSITNVSIVAGTSTVVNLTIGDIETAAASLTLTATPATVTVIPASGLVLAGTTSSRTLTITAPLTAVGTSTVTVQVSDGTATSSRTFTVTVTAPTGTTTGGTTVAVNDEDDDKNFLGCGSGSGLILLSAFATLGWFGFRRRL